MRDRDLATIRRIVQGLKLESKTHFSRKDIDQIIRELELNREYTLAYGVRSMDPANLTALMR